MKSDKPIECVGCNTFDVGSIIDNSERSAQFDKIYVTQEEAEKALAKLVQKARDTESEDEPCQIESDITPVEGGFRLTGNFTFSCQAEVVIFQLGTRAI
ncbi:MULTISPECIES: YfcZ/YiiS family protein [unclassified Lonepinella]|uniref:YfcZ/YiiS family protein n=1 Tax=unclassified Lonepinella TaxID=2642006 RepID=UPI003F6DB506